MAGLDTVESTVDDPSEKDPSENFAMQCQNIVSILRKDKNVFNIQKIYIYLKIDFNLI